MVCLVVHIYGDERDASDNHICQIATLTVCKLHLLDNMID